MEEQVVVAADYLHLFANASAATFADVVFVVEGKRVAAHRCVLAARSSFFDKVFRGDGAARSSSDDGEIWAEQVVPVDDAIGYDALVTVLVFLYSGRLILDVEQELRHHSCGHHQKSGAGAGATVNYYVVFEVPFRALNAAIFFGLHRLSLLIQTHLVEIVEKGLVDTDDVMRVLVVAHQHSLQLLYRTCVVAVAASGLAPASARRRLPPHIAADIEHLRAVVSANDLEGPMTIDPPPEVNSKRSRTIRRMRQALDSMDMELLCMMVAGEGLDLDDAGALHYTVSKCDREAAKALLEMGAVDVNHASSAIDQEGRRRRTALQLACDMADPDLISLLLDHQASPSLPSASETDNPINIIRSAIATLSSDRSSCAVAAQECKLRFCLELLQSAALVEARSGLSVADIIDRDGDDDDDCDYYGGASDRSIDHESEVEVDLQLRQGMGSSQEDIDDDLVDGTAALRFTDGSGIDAELQYSDWAGGGSTVESSSNLADQALTPHSALQPNHGLQFEFDGAQDVRFHTITVTDRFLDEHAPPLPGTNLRADHRYGQLPLVVDHPSWQPFTCALADQDLEEVRSINSNSLDSSDTLELDELIGFSYSSSRPNLLRGNNPK